MRAGPLQIGVFVVALVAPVGCRCGSRKPDPAVTTVTHASAEPQAQSGAPTSDARSLPELLTQKRPAYVTSLAQAREWLDRIEIDPIALRARKIKGKKKLAEQIDAYYRLWQVAPAADKAELLARVRKVAAVTYEDRYHDMLAIDDLDFKQDATSYLRAALLLERLGIDTARYRKEILRLQRRLDEHLVKRGPYQRRMFHSYYEHFGLIEPFPLEGALEEGVIAHRKDARSLTSDDAYDVTHEIYALYDYGDKLDVDPFDPSAKAYLRGTLAALVDRSIAKKDPDLLGEVVECQHYLRIEREPAVRRALDVLLSMQNPDGSWGNYPTPKNWTIEDVRVAFQLHTTLTVIGALTAVFDAPMP